MTINTQQVASIVRQAAAIAAVVIGALDTISMPAAVRGVLVAAGGVILGIEHFVGDPSTGNPPPPPAPPTA